MKLRSATIADYPDIAGALQTWWDSPGFDTEAARKERAALVPRLWLQHFAGTSLIAEEDGALRGFLIGFLSNDRDDEGYIHFVGVAPPARRGGIGRALYERFFETCRAAGRARVRAVTTPTNERSIAYHRALGFELEPGDGDRDGIPFKRDYDGPGLDRTCFVRAL
jgi:ribosomal protein S18 acetylase RimI-like enzyme